MNTENHNPNGQVLIYTNDDNQAQVSVAMVDNDVWLNVSQLSDLFQKASRTISEHIVRIFSTNELQSEKVSRKLRYTTKHGAVTGKTQTRDVDYYNLDMIIAIGYRVNSMQATKFRIWATQQLRMVMASNTKSDARATQVYFANVANQIDGVENMDFDMIRQIQGLLTSSIDYDNYDEDYVLLGELQIKLAGTDMTTRKEILACYIQLAKDMVSRQYPMYVADWHTVFKYILESTNDTVLVYTTAAVGVLLNGKIQQNANKLGVVV